MHRTIIHIDPSNVECGVNIFIPNELMKKDEIKVTIKYFNIGYTDIQYSPKMILNSWFYSEDLKDYYFDSDEPWKYFLFPLNDNCIMQQPYSFIMKTKKNKFNISIRDMYYGNEIPQYYKDDFTLIAVIELE